MILTYRSKNDANILVYAFVNLGDCEDKEHALVIDTTENSTVNCGIYSDTSHREYFEYKNERFYIDDVECMSIQDALSKIKDSFNSEIAISFWKHRNSVVLDGVVRGKNTQKWQITGSFKDIILGSITIQQYDKENPEFIKLETSEFTYYLKNGYVRVM